MFGKGEFAFEKSQPPTNPGKEGERGLTNDSMATKKNSLPTRRRPTSLDMGETKNDKTGRGEAEAPTERTSFLFTDKEGTASSPTGQPGSKTRRSPPTKQATRPDQPFRLIRHGWASSDSEGGRRGTRRKD